MLLFKSFPNSLKSLTYLNPLTNEKKISDILSITFAFKNKNAKVNSKHLFSTSSKWNKNLRKWNKNRAYLHTLFT